MITIRTGKDNSQRDFTIYEKVIRASSEFFDNALKGPWRESTERVVELPEFAGMHFAMYHRWVLTGQLCSMTDLVDPLPAATSKRHEQTYRLYREVLVLKSLTHLGHYLRDTNFTDTVNDALLQCTTELQSHGVAFPNSYGLVFYKVIPEGSPTRLLIADLVAWTTCAKGMRGLRNHRDARFDKDEHADFIMDVLESVTNRFMSATPSTSPLEGWETSCKYHSHGDDKPCYRNKTKTYVTVPFGSRD